MKSRVCCKTSVAKVLKITCLQVFLSPIRLFIREITTYKSLILNDNGLTIFGYLMFFDIDLWF